ncbi:NYN domain-containing protein [Candidatus Shapirobacteria bacterium CG07_land_8_20_14_0_80_39_12]|uniref:NYN domain-containing protein n=1 Tax=Candidatus Shapirobacteria bacterium CG07_land_8_20_14_0_80_39_12 TaxID=1974480 RepID=A0A2M6YQA2_9BACT|nr:MAG: NYN domain-containing protein [Candidatus Shapirobacteria bacterium CG07_land_8_20_14_0_80_39_12]
MPKLKKLNLKDFTKGRVAVFIDAANILYSQKTLGWKIDYQKLKKWVAFQVKLVGLYYYTGKVGKLEKQIKFIHRLENLGYKVIAKEVKFIKINTTKTFPKANLDVELALDAFRLAKEYDTLLLFSGDSDFAYLLDLLKKLNKRTIVISTRGHISKELLERAKYIDLRKLKPFIRFEQKNQELPEGTPEV